MRPPNLTIILAATLLAATAARAATPPKQPERGPGGTDYVSAQVVKRGFASSEGTAYLYHGPGPAPAPRSVVVILHSWGAPSPQVYGGWIEHLARKGHLVVFPRFQEVNRTRPADATRIAASLIRSALGAVADDPDARPDLERVAYLGHLAGAAVAMNLAAGPQEDKLPAPKLVFALMPGGIASDEKARGILLKDLSAIDKSVLLITMSGDRDYIPTDRASRRILKEAASVPSNRKLLMRASSDDHGFPTITATLASPGSPKADYDPGPIKVVKVPDDPLADPRQKSPVWRWSADMSLSGEQTVLSNQLASNVTDTLDWLAYWKTFDMALEAAFAGRDAASLKADPRFTDMGTWSDGWPVRRLSADLPKAEAEGDAKPQAGPRRRL